MDVVCVVFCVMVLCGLSVPLLPGHAGGHAGAD